MNDSTPPLPHYCTDFEHFRDVIEPEDVCVCMMMRYPDGDIPYYRAMLATLLYWIRRGAYISEDTRTVAKLVDIPAIVDDLLPIPIPEGSQLLLI